MLPHIIGIETAIRENRTDDETMRRIRAKQIIYAPEDGPVNGRIVALLTIRHLVIEVGAEGMLRCNKVTAPLKYSKVMAHYVLL
jgi:hypothetical protein